VSTYTCVLYSNEHTVADLQLSLANAGVKVERSTVKDQLVISGNDVDLVSRSAALINQVKPLLLDCGLQPCVAMERCRTMACSNLSNKKNQPELTVTRKVLLGLEWTSR